MTTAIISDNDKRLAARDACENMEKQFGLILTPYVRGATVSSFIELINKYPPDAPTVRGVKCKHGYDDNHWCPRCQGTIPEGE